MTIVTNFLLAIHVLVSLLIILVVLMQRPKSEGLGAAFGGGMTENLFGAQTTNVLQNFTRWLGVIFFLLTLVLSMIYAHQASVKSKDSIKNQLLSIPAPAAATPEHQDVTPLAPAKPDAGEPLKLDPSAAAPVAPEATATPAGMSLQTATPAAGAPAASATPAASASPSPSASPAKKPADAKKNAH